MKRILTYLFPFRKRMAIGFSIKVMGTLIELFLPYILTHILKNVVATVNLPSVLFWGALMILCAFLACISNIIANRMAAKVSRDFSERMRRELFSKTLSLSASQLDQFTIPSLESRITTDTYHVHNFVSMMQRMGVRAPILLIGGIIITLIMDARLALVMIALLPIIFITVFLISKRGIPLYSNVQKATDGMIRVVREDSQGIRVIKALSKNEYENRRFDGVNSTLVKSEMKAGIVTGAVNPIMTFLMNGGIAAVTLLSAFLVADGISDPETVIAFMQYFTLISMAMMTVSRIFVMYTKCSASAKRISEVLSAPVLLSREDFSKSRGEEYIKFENVSFSYNNKSNHVENITFSINRGDKLGIIGATGSGKSTLLQLLFRFYDVTEGSIKIDGCDVRAYGEKELAEKFGIALQNDFLYADTIEENIRFGRDISHEDVVRAAKIAQADDFIRTFPDGYSHILSQKGTNVSGGQKQRILIARAVAARPDILVLDDSSSALDYKTDANLRRALAEELSDATVITVAQRVSSIMHCDLILVLDNGRIIGRGNHAYLMENCSVYKEISDSQMGGAFVE